MRPILTPLFLGLLLGIQGLAHADKLPIPAQTPASYAAECGSCHLAYPPALLQAAGWQQLMANLDRHFGSDARVDRKEHAEIASFLSQHAGTSTKLETADRPVRISQTTWFLREHRKIPARYWLDPKVKSPANCEGCHVNAAKGSYREREIAFPELR